MNQKKILICGHRSFASRGLFEALERAGHEVVCFSRGKEAEAGCVVTGSVYDFSDNLFLKGKFDVVINYIILKDKPVETNIRYIDSLLKFCVDHTVDHLIHVSSISVYKTAGYLINEVADVETNPAKKGSYGGLKVATEQHIVKHVQEGIRLSIVRPGFILGEGLVTPIVGTGIRMPCNRILAIGNAGSQFPLITRKIVNTSLVNLLTMPKENGVEEILLVNSSSPSRKEYLKACCSVLGCGVQVLSIPSFIWRIVGLMGICMGCLPGLKKMKRLGAIMGTCQKKRYNSSQSESKLGANFSFDWKKELRGSMDGQVLNFKLTDVPVLSIKGLNTESVAFLGFGHIVAQKHLPALKKVDFSGRVLAYDLKASEVEGQKICAIQKESVKPSNLYIVTSPGPVHTDAINYLKNVKGPVLVEKPLCYSMDELNKWKEFSKTRDTGVFVCHNYRFKKNTVKMVEYLRKYNSGGLKHVFLNFHSPPVKNDWAVWRRKERLARTLLMDYSMHFLDLACMFNDDRWVVNGLNYELNRNGETSLIKGMVDCDSYSVSFVLRQGFMPRVAKLMFVFQNYSISLGFFPDTFVVQMSNDNPFIHWKEGWQSVGSISTKVLDKLTGRDSDLSHALIYSSMFNSDLKACESITVDAVSGFYKLLFDLSERIYE